MTTDEMRAARERGADQSDFDLIRRNAAAGIPPAEDEDAPRCQHVNARHTD